MEQLAFLKVRTVADSARMSVSFQIFDSRMFPKVRELSDCRDGFLFVCVRAHYVE